MCCHAATVNSATGVGACGGGGREAFEKAEEAETTGDDGIVDTEFTIVDEEEDNEEDEADEEDEEEDEEEEEDVEKAGAEGAGNEEGLAAGDCECGDDVRASKMDRICVNTRF